jgi:dethiobiotin synthetase
MTTEEAATAVRQLHRSVLDGRSLNVRFYKPIRREMEEEAAAAAMLQQQQQGPPHMQIHMSHYHPHHPHAQQHYSHPLMAAPVVPMARRHVMRGLH